MFLAIMLPMFLPTLQFATGELTLTHPNTISLSSEGIFQSEHNVFVVEVQACRDADVNMFPVFFINIGGWGNSKSVIYLTPNFENLVEYDAVLLDCANFSSFWISLNSFQVHVGTGATTAVNEIMSAESQCPNHITDMILGSNFGATASWRIQSSGKIEYNQGHFCGNTKSCSVMMKFMSAYSQSKVGCASICDRYEECKTIKYDKDLKICHMYSDSHGSDEIVSQKIFWKC